MIIADTHVIIWDALQPEKLSRNAVGAITAIVYNYPLVTADRNLREAECVVTVW